MPSSRNQEPPSFWDNPQNFFSSIGDHLPQPSSFPSAAVAKREAQAYSRDIFASCETLHAILDRYEGLIRRRWSKKSQDQRKKVLLGAWPRMSLSHRPDYKVIDSETVQERRKGTRYREAYLWPYINIEDLVQGKSLLLFLNSRGRHLPEAFSNADIEAAHVGIVSMAISRSFLNGYTMRLHGQTTVHTYGKMLSWDDDDRAFDWMMSGVGKQPGEGLLILEIQKKILDFLVQCCRLLLADLPPESLTDKDIPIQPEPEPIVTDPTAWPSLAAMSMEAPYRVPAHPDFKRLQAIIAANLSAAKDHLWALREDPGYFANVAFDSSEHRMEVLRDDHGKQHPRLNKPVFWGYVLRHIVTGAYGSLLLWEGLHNQLTLLVTLKDKYARSISPMESLPSEYMDALLLFRYLLDRAINLQIQELVMIAPSSPPLRSHFVRETQIPNSTKMSCRSKGTKSSLMYLLGLLLDKDQLFLHGLPNIVDDLDTVLRHDPTQNSLVTPFVAESISKLAVLAESLRQLSLYQPWSSNMEFDNTAEREDFKTFYNNSTSRYSKLPEALTDVPLADLGTPTHGWFNYPVDKRRTKENVKVMRKAEQNLDAFWRAIDDEAARKDSALQGLATLYNDAEGRELQRTPEWVEPVQQVQKTVKEEMPYEAFARASLDPKRSNPIVADEKIKIKTRGLARKFPHIVEQAVPDNSDHQPSFVVGKRALKVFSVLFHTPSAESDNNPGEIPWLDFVHALHSVGFAALKLYGSVWQCTPTKLDVERSIQFHEPHPHGRIPFVVARRHGRRLNRANGWYGGMFVSDKG
ncbi:hypothetical protein MMC26_002882 [Xylographa opegraphella]|nr:hypothetical protein [Xylographa opegraphella]